MAKHRTRVGLHARNDVLFPEYDYALVRQARIETLKMMSLTDVGVYERLRRENPDLEFIVRLYDDRLRRDSRPSPPDFVAKMVPLINRLKPYVAKFEIHNEPNHVDGIEGWGASDENARAFRAWYLQVLAALKQACPWASFGFPGLALNYPHRDLEWLDICRDAIQASDWLGCHTYWQYGNMMKKQWGLRFQLYHERFPDKRIEITEFGDSTPNRPPEEIARQYVRYYQELNKYPYLRSASAFIASSPDPAWNLFVWMKPGGEMLPVVHAIANMERKAVEVGPIPKPPPPKPVPPPTPKPTERRFPQTGKTVRGGFLEFFDRYGLDICGYPITDQFQEFGLPAQYFQRIALEEFKPGKLRLKLVGTEAWTSRAKIAALEKQIEALQQQPPGPGPVKPPIQDITDKLPTHPTRRYPSRALGDINQIVIHHTATSPTITPRRIAEYQVRKLDKPGITYHFVITADGVIYQTNKLETVSDHAYSRNRGSIGVCFTGNFTNAIPTTAQLQAGGQLSAWLLSSLRLPLSKIVGLREFVNTQSPGKQWLSGQRWKDKLLAEVEAVLESAGEDQSALIASLRAQIEDLEAEIERLKARPPDVPSPSLPAVQRIVDHLAALIASLREQTQALQRENARLLAELKAAREAAGEDQSALIASLRKKIGDLQQARSRLQAEVEQLEAALEAKDDEQSALIASLRARIKGLQQEIDRLKQLPPPPPPPPVTGQVSKPPIQNLIGKLAKHPTKKYKTRPRSAIKALVIHHSATPATITPKRIAEYHVKNLDWPGIGYHFLVAADGIIYQTNRLETQSNHATKANPFGVGICFLGNFTKRTPPPVQLKAGAHLVAWLMQELDVELDNVRGHLKFTQTSCPGRQWLKGKKWKQLLRQEIAKIQQEAAQPAPAPGAKPLYHYMLFWARDGKWAKKDWQNAQNYIGAFQPSVGFRTSDAVQAEYVTIVGGPLGVSKEVEDWLKANGCKVDRIAGTDEAETKRLLDELAQQGRRFRSFSG